MQKKLLLGIIFSAFSFLQKTFCQAPIFKNGDRISFIGSSIAMNGANFRYINLFYATRYPEIKVTFLNAGISGDVTDGIIRRFESDILYYKPTWAVLMLEENDLRPALYSKERLNEPGIMEKRQKALDRWINNSDTIVRKLLDANIKVILETPTIYDQTGDLPSENESGVNDALKKCADHLKQLSMKYQLPLVDCWTILKEVNKVVQKKDPKKSIIGEDRVHVSPMGYFVMAYQFLKSSSVNKIVSSTVINAAKNKLVSQLNCSVSDLKANRNHLSFQQTENSLPFPSPSGIGVDSFFSFTSQMNSEILKVKKLKPGNYKVTIDQNNIGSFTKRELKKGINLSSIKNTPQYLQAERVLEILDEYWGYLRKLRQIKYVEYQLMDEQMRKTPLTKENAKELIEKRMEKFKDQKQEYQEFYQKNFNEYQANKPMEKEFLEKAANAFDELYRSNMPVGHYYKVDKMD